jgi:hypothetical protein
MASDRAPTPGERRTLWATRYGLPAGIALAGFVLTLVGSSDAVVALGATLIGLAPLVIVLNLLMRLAVQSGDDREREERARRYFDCHGHWPGASRER